jgi:hypothetical protein
MAYYGVDGAEWGTLSTASLDYLKSKGITAIRMVMYIRDWNSNLVHWLTGDHIKTKFPQISSWCHSRGMKLIITAFGTEWDPPESWDTMKLNAINNVAGAGTTWINTYADVVDKAQPDALEIMNEPPEAISYATYKAWCTTAINVWRAVKSDLTIIVMSIPWWDLTAVTESPFPFSNIIYDCHYYYSYDNSNPATWGFTDQPQLDYWNGNLSAAKTELYNYLDNTNMCIKAAQDVGLPIMFGESGTNYLNPNYLQFMRDFIEYCQTRNIIMIDHIYRMRSETNNGLLTTINPPLFNELGMVLVDALNPVKIAGLSIQIQDGSLCIDNDFVGVNWDSWAAKAYLRKHVSYGNARSWTFTCIENVNATPWVNSVAYQLYLYIKSGVAVAFEYGNGIKYSIPYGTMVYVEGIDVWYGDNMAVRYFTISVKAA